MTTQLRLSDAERQRAADALGEHYAAGRLDYDEHGERLGAVWAAKTYDQLPALFADLPGGSPVSAPGFAWDARHHSPARRAAAFPDYRGHRRPSWVLPVLIVLVVLGAFALVAEHPILVLVALMLVVLAKRRKRRRSRR